MMKNTLLYLLILTFLAGCGTKNSETARDGVEFPDSIEKSWTFLTDDQYLPSVISDIVASDSSIYVLGKNNGNWLHVFNANSGNLEGCYLTRGSQDGQLENPVKLNLDLKSGNFDVYDYTLDYKYKVKYFDKDFHPTKKIDVKTAFYVAHDIIDLYDGRMLVTMPTKTPEGKATHRDEICIKDSETFETLSSYEGMESSDTLLAGISRIISVAPSRKGIASVHFRGGTLEIYKLNGDTIDRTFVKTYFPVEYIYREGSDFPDIDQNIRYGFWGVAATDDYIYATYCDSKEEGGENNVIGVWDWDGNPVRKIITDYDIWRLAASPDGKRLYCTLTPEGAGRQLRYIEL